MAYPALLVHITVVNGGDKPDFRSPEGVVSREVDIEKEQPIFVGRLLGAKKQHFPNIDVFAWENGHKGVRVVVVVLDLFCDSLQTCVTGNLFLPLL